MSAKDKTFWDQDRMGGVRASALRAPNADEVTLVAEQHAYLELICFERDQSAKPEQDFESDAFDVPVLIRDPLGWMMQYWASDGENIPSIISIARAEGWQGCGLPEENLEEEGDARLITSSGTPAKQGVSMILRALEVARQHGWQTVQISGGTEDLQSLAWCLAQEAGPSPTGYQPSAADQSRHIRIQSLLSAEVTDAPKATPGMGPGASGQGSFEDDQ